MGFRYQADVWKLLQKNISKWQLFGYSLANVIGLSVVLMGILFYNDSKHDNSHEDKYFSNDYVVLSKRVDGLGFAPKHFTNDEIDELSDEAWVRKVGRFTSSQFAVNGAVNIGGKELSTYLFLESVPDDFFDIKPRDWSFDLNSRFVPIILSKDYLTLYNYGFAIPQGLPQVSEEIVGAIPVTLQLTGDGMKTAKLDAGIVGFSSRLNTIAVPQSFMDWANGNFSRNEARDAYRLIVEVDPLLSSDMKDYAQEREIEISGSDDSAGNISTFLGVVSTVVTLNGLMICALSIFILILSIFLLLQKSKEKLRNLMLLGYHPMDISRYYGTIVVALNLVIAVFSVIIAIVSRNFWIDGLMSVGLGGASQRLMFLFALLYLLLVTSVDIYIIRAHLLKIWNGK